jgi:hypothetical protein
MSEADLIAEYRKHLEQGAHFAALAKLGELIFRVTPQRSGTPEQGDTVALDTLPCPDMHVGEAALAEARGGIRRCLQILDTGGRYEWEEFVWVLTLRLQVKFAKSVMMRMNLDCGDLDLTLLESELTEATCRTENRAAFASAVTAVASNWGLAAGQVWPAA